MSDTKNTSAESPEENTGVTDEIIGDNEWKCPKCGTVNQNYVGSCGCGQIKPPAAAVEKNDTASSATLKIVRDSNKDTAVNIVSVRLNNGEEIFLQDGAGETIALMQKRNKLCAYADGKLSDNVEFEAPEIGSGEIHLVVDRFQSRGPKWNKEAQKQFYNNPQTQLDKDKAAKAAKLSGPEKRARRKLWAASIFIALATAEIFSFAISFHPEVNEYSAYGSLYTILMTVIGAALVFLAVFSIISYLRAKKEHNIETTKLGLLFPIFGTIVLFFFVTIFLFPFTALIARKTVNIELGARYGSVISSQREEDSLSEHTHFIFYDETKNTFEFPDKEIYSNTAENVDDVDLIVSIKSESSLDPRYVYVLAGTDTIVDDAMIKVDTFRIIRTDNGGIVASGTTESHFPKKETGEAGATGLNSGTIYEVCDYFSSNGISIRKDGWDMPDYYEDYELR